MISRIIKKTVDLNKVQKVDQLEGPLYQLENGGHTFEITCLMDGTAASVSGTVSARFLRADGITEYFTGTLSGNIASITLPQACYNVNGRFGMVVFITGSGVTSAVYGVAGSVYKTTSDQVVDPTEVIPSLEDLIAKIQDCEDATEAAEAAAAFVPNVIAPAYASNTAYSAGDYITDSGKLYRVTADITAANNTALSTVSKTQVTTGAEIGDLKSAITAVENGNKLYSFGSERLSTGRIINDTNGMMSDTANTRYIGNVGGTLSINGARTVVISTDSSKVAWVKYAFYYNGSLVGSVVQITEVTDTISINAPSNVASMNVCLYASGSSVATSVKESTKITADASFFEGLLDNALTSDALPAQGKATGDAITKVANEADAIYNEAFQNAIANNAFQSGLIMTNSTGTLTSTTNLRYYGTSPQYIDLSEFSGNLYISMDSAYTSWVKVAFFDASKSLLEPITQVLASENAFVQVKAPAGTAFAVVAGYSSGQSAEVIAQSIATTKVDAYPVEKKASIVIGLKTPERYELVVGDTFQLFYNGIIQAADSRLYDILITCSKGTPYSRYFQFTPKAADVGTTAMTISMFDTNHVLIDTKTVNLVVKAKAQNPQTAVNVLYVGDSLTSGGYAPGEFKRRIVENDGTPVGDGLTNVHFIGAKSNGYVNYEGQGGRSWVSYNTESLTNSIMWITCVGHGKTVEDQHSIYKDSNNKEWKLETIETDRIMIIRESSSGTLPASGTLTWVSGGANTGNIVYTASEQAPGNPFWNGTANKVDFAYYVTGLGENHLDYVYVLLGWNYFGMSETSLKNNVHTFIDNVLASYPSCKVVLLGLEMPSKDGLAVNYGASDQLLAKYFDAVSYVYLLNKWYEEIANETEYTGKVYYVNVSGQFDTQYNMPYTQKAVNTRNTTTEIIQNNGVHPAVNGYYQIADACYRDFVHRLQDT